MSKPAGRRRQNDLSRTLAHTLSVVTLTLCGMVFGAAGAGVYDIDPADMCVVGS
jgi:hypothetical protein